MTNKHTQAETTEVIRTHIEASNPCSFASVVAWAKNQGYGGSKMVKAITALNAERVISLDDSLGYAVIELN